MPGAGSPCPSTSNTAPPLPCREEWVGPPAAPSLTVGAAHLEGPCLSKPTQPMVGGSLGAPQVCTELGGLWQLDTGRWSPGENAGPSLLSPRLSLRCPTWSSWWGASRTVSRFRPFSCTLTHNQGPPCYGGSRQKLGAGFHPWGGAVFPASLACHTLF